MILVDTSVWVDHFRRGDARLAGFLENGAVVMHPFIIGELACGNLADRASTINALLNMPAAGLAESDEVLAYVEHHKLFGKGIGYIDAHLLASAALDRTQLWTRDQRLRAVAEELGQALPDNPVPGSSA